MAAPSAAIIIDTGSGYVKAGCTKDETPRTVFPTVCATIEGKKYFGNEAQQHVGEVDLEYPIQRDKIQDADGMEKIWNHVIHEKLQLTPHKHPLFVTAPALCDVKTKSLMTQIGFESFNAPSMFVGYQSVLSLYASGMLQGLVLESGYGKTRAVPVVEGFAQPEFARQIDVAGQDLDDFLVKLLADQGQSFKLPGDLATINDIKERFCYVTKDFEEESKKAEGEVGKEYKLPDGRDITIGKERFTCPELLFRPELHGKGADGIHKIIANAILASGRKEMFGEIVLAGGSTMFAGIKERLEAELSTLTTETISIKYHEARNISAFIGASILTALPDFAPMWVTKQEYEEQGEAIVAKKMK